MYKFPHFKLIGIFSDHLLKLLQSLFIYLLIEKLGLERDTYSINNVKNI